MVAHACHPKKLYFLAFFEKKTKKFLFRKHFRNESAFEMKVKLF